MGEFMKCRSTGAYRNAKCASYKFCETFVNATTLLLCMSSKNCWIKMTPGLRFPQALEPSQNYCHHNALREAGYATYSGRFMEILYIYKSTIITKQYFKQLRRIILCFIQKGKLVLLFCYYFELLKLKNTEVGCKGSEQGNLCTGKRGSLNTLRKMLKVKVYLIIKVAYSILFSHFKKWGK